MDSPDILEAIRASLTSHSKTYHYVLPTQLIAKAADHTLDARFLQKRKGIAGAFDARSIAQKIIVPFDREYDRVLGGSPEPYVNNPLRVPKVTLDPEVRDAQDDKAGWDNLYLVLQAVEDHNDPVFTLNVLEQTQIEIARLLGAVRVSYPTPRRVSLGKTRELLESFLQSPSGGDKAQAVATALLGVVGHRFGLYSEVKRAKTNAADAASGQVADLECREKGRVILAVEVKDVKLTINQIEEKIGKAREHKVTELLYLVKTGIEQGQETSVRTRIQAEFSSGQNIYVFDLQEFAHVLLALLGEEGRSEFVIEVGRVLDEYTSPLRYRREWAALLRSA